MKKFIVGLVSGIGLALFVSVQAEEVPNFIGSTIEGQFPVRVNGNTISTPAIVVDGISYLPTRTLTEMLGYTVKFNSEIGIELTKEGGGGAVGIDQSSGTSGTVPSDEPIWSEEEILLKIKAIDEKIFRIRNTRIRIEQVIINDPRSSEEGKEKAKLAIAQYEAEIKALEIQKSELEAKLSGTPK